MIKQKILNTDTNQVLAYMKFRTRFVLFLAESDFVLLAALKSQKTNTKNRGNKYENKKFGFFGNAQKTEKSPIFG